MRRIDEDALPVEEEMPMGLEVLERLNSGKEAHSGVLRILSRYSELKWNIDMTDVAMYKIISPGEMGSAELAEAFQSFLPMESTQGYPRM